MKLANENHIVMVDDNPGDLDLARICCQRSKVPNPWLSFERGESFLEYLNDVKVGNAPMPSLVLLDINMPGLSGVEVLHQVRSDPHFDQLPIFCVLTSSADLRDREAVLAEGASGFVTKPDDIHEYIRFFDSLLD